MNGWQAKFVVTALWAVAYALISWVLVAVTDVQKDVSAMRATLIRIEREASEFVTKRELDLRGDDIRRRLEKLEQRR